MSLLASREILAALASPLVDELGLLRSIGAALARGEDAAEFFPALHAATLRDARTAELQAAYAELWQSPEPAWTATVRTELALQAAWFFEEQADAELAVDHVLCALALEPSSQRALGLAETLLIESEDFATLSRLYLSAAEHSEPTLRKRLLKHALVTLTAIPAAETATLALKDRLLREAPEEQIELLDELVDYYRHAGLDQQLAELLSALLEREAPPAQALAAAEALLDQPELASWLLGLLAATFERLGRHSDELSMLTRELRVAEGDRLRAVQRRLAGLKQELYDDSAGALELLEELLAADASDDAARAQYIGVAVASGQRLAAADFLLGTLERTPSADARVRIDLDAARLFLASSRPEQAHAAYLAALSEQAEPELRLASARELLQGRAALPAELERAALLVCAELEPDAGRRAELLFSLGTLQRTKAGDLPGAAALWQRAAQAAPTHAGVHEALLSAYSELGDAERLDGEIMRGLSVFDAALRETTLVRFADALLARGRGKEILPLASSLLERETLGDGALDALERLAVQAEDPSVLEAVLRRCVDTAQEPVARARALERLGEFFDEWRGDKDAASQTWKQAASVLPPRAEDPESQRLYERALDAAPSDSEAASHLVDLYAAAGDWPHVAETCGLLLRGEHERATLERLLSLEEHAVRAGAVEEFGALVDEALWSWGEDAAPFARRLLGAKARAFARLERLDEAAGVYQTLIEAHGAEADVRAFEALIAASSGAEWRFDRLRWLFNWRLKHAEDPLAIELEWAAAEEHTFGDPGAAIAVLERALKRAPDNSPAWKALTRLKLTTGDVAGGLSALASLREHGGGNGVALEMAALLIQRLDQPAEALPIVLGALAENPEDALARRLLESLATSHSAVSFQACQELEQLSEKSDAPEQRRAILLTLLAQSEPSEAGDKRAAAKRKALRRRWFKSLLEVAEGATALELFERAAEEFMADPVLWEAAESMAARLGDPGIALTAYERALERELGGELAEMLGERLRAFAAEHVEDPRRIEPALLRVLALAPGARWALDHVKFSLSAGQRFDELLALYDRAIAAASDDDSRRALLDEAAIAARDVAGDAERAIGYWQGYLLLEPEDTRVDGALERLYERRGHSEQLIQHLTRRSERVDADERGVLRQRIAALHAERHETAQALDALKKLLADSPESEAAYELLERLLAEPTQPPDEDAWDDAPDLGAEIAGLLKARYRALGRPADVARVLEVELSRQAAGERRITLLEELAALRQHELGDPAGAFGLYGELLRVRPGSQPYRAELCALGVALGAHDKLVGFLLAAAAGASPAALRCELLADAVALCLGPLADRPRATAIYLELFAAGRGSEAELSAARALDGLLAELARGAERCSVLERLAEIEPEPAPRQAAREAAAALALNELGEPLRAAENYRAMLAAEPESRTAHDGLIRALEAGRRPEELCEALIARAELLADAEGRPDFERAARLCASELGDMERAITLWRLVRERFGRSEESLSALRSLLSAGSRFPELAELLEAEALVSDAPAALYAELAELYKTRLDDPARAITAYEHGQDFVAAAELLGGTPGLLTDDALQSLELARALGERQRFGEAERILRRQLDHYGPRHPKGRKSVHLELCALLRNAGQSERALAEVIGASQHDPSDPELMLTVAQLALERGERERAEQAYRSLLLVLHGGRAEGVVTRAEVYLELAALLGARGEQDAARDMEASAFEAGQSSESEALGLEATLRRLGRPELLERALGLRLERAKTPAEASLALASFVEHHAARGTLEGEPRTLAEKLAEKLGRELSRLKKSMDLEPLRRLVAVYATLGQPERALSLLDTLATKTSSAEERHALELDVARQLLALPERRAEGITRLQKLVAKEPAEATPELAELLARALEDDGKPAEALAVLLGARSAGTASLELLRALVRLRESTGDSSPASIEDLEALLELEQGAAALPSALRLVELRRAAGDQAGLERALERAVGLEPARPDLRDQLIEAYESRADFASAQRVLERAAQSTPSDARLRARLGRARYRVLLEAGRSDEALAELERASELDKRLVPELVSALEQHAELAGSERWILRLADAYLAKKDVAKARACLAAYLERAPHSTDVLRRAALLAQDAGDAQGALPLFRRLLRAPVAAAGDPAARVSELMDAGRLFFAAGDEEATLEALTQLRALDPDHVEALELYARVLGARGEHAQALALLEEYIHTHARARSRPVLPAYRALAQLHLANDDLVEAKDALLHAHQLDRSDLGLALTLGLVAVDLDELELALSTLRAVTSAKDKSDAADSLPSPEALSLAFFNLARIEHRKGQRTTARRMAARAVQENPQHADAARLLRQLGAS